MAKSKDNIREAAYQLYKSCGWSQDEVAKFLKVAPKTVSEWARADNWRQKKLTHNLFQENSAEDVMEMIDFQIKLIKKINSLHQERVDKSEDPDELKGYLIDNGKVDGLQKLFTVLQRQEVEWVAYVKVLQEFIKDFIGSEDPKMAEKVWMLADQFLIKKKLKD
jgi:transcriptional regulator with XRE-family HTH domain